jgi:hypothetical protein
MARPNPRPQLQRLEDRSTPATLSGTVFADVNGNGVQDAGEVGLAGVTVQVDAGGAGAVVTTTDPAGNFSVAGLADGAHTINVLPPLGTTAIGETFRVVNVSGGADVSGLTFALQPQGKVAGTVFTDLNNNGVRDPGEPGVAGATVTLDTMKNGGVDAAVSTGADGSYVFLNVPDGSHFVTVVPPVHNVATTPNPQAVTVTAGSEVDGADFALRPASAISGRVLFADINPGRPGIPGVTVQLDVQSDGKAAATSTTDSTGTFLFTNIPNGTHTITVVAPPGSTFNVPANSNKITTVVNSDIQGGLNFGVTFPGSVSGGLFLDRNNNGVRDPGEQGLTPARVQVDLYGAGNPVDVGAKTAADGSFVVSGLPDGTHTLIVTPPDGYSAGPTRTTFTITDGSQASVQATGLKSLSGSVLTVGSGTAGAAQTYTFLPADGGALTTVAGRSITIPGVNGGTRVVTADFNGDGVDDVITATGPGVPAMIHVYDGATGAELVPGGIGVFERSFTGGLNLAAGDFNHDGKADIVVSADTGGGPRVQVLNAAQFLPGADPTKGLVLADFLGIDDPDFRGGARTAVGDVNGDGVPDLIVAAGVGGGPRVAIFDGRTINPAATPTRLVADFFVFEAALRNGATVAVGDVNGDGRADLIAGAGPGGAPRVAVFDGSGIMAGLGIDAPRVADFYVANDFGSRAGTRVTVKDLDRDGKADIVATDGGQAYVYTAAGIKAFQMTPLPGQTGPGTSAAVAPFGKDVFIG